MQNNKLQHLIDQTEYQSIYRARDQKKTWLQSLCQPDRAKLTNKVKFNDDVLSLKQKKDLIILFLHWNKVAGYLNYEIGPVKIQKINKKIILLIRRNTNLEPNNQYFTHQCLITYQRANILHKINKFYGYDLLHDLKFINMSSNLTHGRP